MLHTNSNVFPSLLSSRQANVKKILIILQEEIDDRYDGPGEQSEQVLMWKEAIRSKNFDSTRCMCNGHLNLLFWTPM